MKVDWGYWKAAYSGVGCTEEWLRNGSGGGRAGAGSSGDGGPSSSESFKLEKHGGVLLKGNYVF